jgi:hypothetical protein
MRNQIWSLCLLFVACAAAADNSPAVVTFHKDVLPILQRHCQTCHRPGNVAPMSFLTYQSTRPWAKAIKAAVLTRRMPPWSADAAYGHFANDPSLQSSELEIITKRADTGALPGDEKDAPVLIQWPANGWTTQPDLVLKGVPYTVPGTNPAQFAIPPNDSNYGPAPSEATFLVDADPVWMSPHMHLRGKDMTYKLVFPDGKEKIVVDVPHYDFNWQLGYYLLEPIHVPKGSKLIVSGHYDNSVNNKFNPDPNRTVYQGNMTWEEMFAPFFAITVDKDVNPAKALRIPFATGGA